MNTLQQLFPNMGKGVKLLDTEVLQPYANEYPLHEFYEDTLGNYENFEQCHDAWLYELFCLLEFDIMHKGLLYIN